LNGIVLDFCYNTYIEHCYFQSVAGDAISNVGTTGDPDWLVVRDNIFTACATAMDLDDTDYMVIERNQILQCPTGITLDGASYAKVKDNVINTTVANGVVAISGQGAAECTIHGNVLHGDPTGTDNLIDLSGGSNNMVSDNYLSCTIAQYDTTCSDSTSGSWVRNHCVDGETAAAPT
jgi:hypothetical protein